MGDAKNDLYPSKKRVAGRELSRDNPGLDDEEDGPEQEIGTFKRASDEVLATRRFVKVRHKQPPSSPSFNPFASIHLVPPPTESSVKPAGDMPEAHANAEKEVSKSVDEKSNADKETEKRPEANDPKGQDKNSLKLENKSVGTEVESDANKEKESPTSEATKPEKSDENETAAGEETEKQNSCKDTSQVAESVADKEKESPASRATKPEKSDESEAAAGEETEKEDRYKDTSQVATAETEKEAEKDNVSPVVAAAHLSAFQPLSSSQNAFTGLAGTGFSSSSFSFSAIPKDEPAFGSGSAPLFGLKNDKPSSFSFSFGNSNNGKPSLFGTIEASTVTKSEGSSVASMQEVPVETGEENEKAVFIADAILFEYLDGGWKERGKGELKVNVSTTGTERARLVMRARGNYRLILNASLYADMTLANMDKRGITFACMNSIGEGKDGLSTFALKFKDGSIMEEFRTAVTTHKGRKTTVLKTPENSPKASDD
ncbi:PREDICTED: nuclear pore complex protein NUP50A-like [Nelumbo nucifera]|uniref:Nuclear pore complex protein NUP50A-like n=1 Tax=Nelumbo nucifera TaxID=4432 RepID=A0A1U7ZLR1_NELNU|nr:PREDICTED: nuclear pore complex protein NUP50A-like [Nelumbo nucifera]